MNKPKHHSLIILLLTTIVLPLRSAHANMLVLPVHDDFLKGSVLHKGGAPTGSIVYEGLVTKKKNGGYKGWLAKSWESNSNSSVWTFHLVHNATWHDNTSFTSKDVKFTHDYLKQKKIWFGSVLKMVREVECPDKHTVVFKLKNSCPAFLDSLSHCPGIVVLPEHFWNNVENPMRFNDTKHIGTGPYCFGENISGQFQKLIRFKNYHGNKPEFSSIVLKNLQNKETSLMALKSGQIDALDSLSPWAAKQLDKDEEISIMICPQKRLYELCLNCKNYPTSEIFFRTAIAHSINKEKITQIVFQQFGHPENQWLLPVVGSQCRSDKFFNHAFNPGLALNILEKHGFRVKDKILYDNNNEKTRVSFLLGGKGDKNANNKIAELIAADLENIGIIVEFKQVDQPTWFKAARKVNMFVMAMPDLMHDDPDDLGHFHTSSFFSKPNWHGYSNTAFDRVYEILNQTENPEKRAELALSLQEILSSETPTLPLCTVDEPIAYRNDKIMFSGDAHPMYGQLIDLETILSIKPAQTTN